MEIVRGFRERMGTYLALVVGQIHHAKWTGRLDPLLASLRFVFASSRSLDLFRKTCVASGRSRTSALYG